MQKSVLREVVLSLSDKEVRELGKWLASPAHNHRDDAIRLFDFLAKQGGAKASSKEDAWKAIFPGEPYDDAFMRQVMYFLLKAIEDYFIFKEYKSETTRPMLSLASLYRRRQLDKPFRQTIEAARKDLANLPLRNSEYHLDKFYLEQERYYYLAATNPMGEINLQDVSDELDMAYVANKLRLACRMLSHQSVNKTAKYDIGLLEPVLQIVEQGKMLNEPGVAVYYYGFKALTDGNNTSHFEHLARILHQHGSAFPAGELKELYLLSINYCTGRINMGQEEFFQIVFNLYKEGFGQLIIISSTDNLSKFMFSNAVYSAVKIKNFEWAENFITQFGDRLEEKHRHSTVQFNLSRLYYERGDYHKAQILLREFEYDDMLLNAVAKTMLLKIYYKLGEYDALESLIEAMRSFLQRKAALSPTHKIIFKNTIYLMKKLVNLNHYSKVQVEKFRQAVIDTNPMQKQEKEWFLQQIERNR